MQIRSDQLEAHLARGVKPLYTLVSDEPLLVQEACDAIRAAARAAGCTEREVFHVAGANFDWSGVLGAAQEMSLFAAAKLVEIRIPSGKPGAAGSDALQRYCSHLPEGVVTLVLLPRLDGRDTKSAWFAALDGAGVVLRIDGVERPQLPAWIAQRLERQGQRVRDGDEGRRTLAFFADRVEGNLLAAHQEVNKLALLYPAGELSAEQVEAAVLDVARYDVRQLCEAVWTGQVGRASRMLEGLRDEGESAVSVLWQLADDLRAIARVHDALAASRPLPLALVEARVWGPRQRLIERALPAIGAAAAARLLVAASTCDGITKGLRRADWPADPWGALRRLVLMALHFTAAGAGRTPGTALVLTGQ
jgi:DNA polymerase-3 subunit delta